MCLADKTVVCIFTSIHRSHAVEFTNQDTRNQVVDGEWIIGMLLQHPLEILNGVVMIEIVEVFKTGVGQRIASSDRNIFGPRFSRTRRLRELMS